MNTDRRGAGLASFGALSVLVLAMQRGAVGGAPQVQPSIPRPRLPSVAAPAQPRNPARTDACHALVEALQGKAGSPGADTCSDAFESFLRDHELCSSINGAALIATLPDPLESRLAQSFDDGLAALVLAMERTGALVDYWLPWAADRHASQQSEAGLRLEYSGSPPGLVRARPSQSKCHGSWPGVVLFGATTETNSVLLIVGEGPTVGVDRAVLRRAVELASHLHPPVQSGSGAADTERKIRIVGPRFSGSSRSMRKALQPLAEKGKRFEIVSGSATARKNFDILSVPDRMRFSATVVPDDVAAAGFYRYLHESGAVGLDGNCVLQNVALLVEADTVYTQVFGKDGAKGPCYGGTGIDYFKVQPRFKVFFPMHVALVRNVLDRRPPPADGSNSVLKLPMETVPLDPDEGIGGTRDDIPNFSRDTAAYDDRALTSALGLFRENDVSVVGILATDTRDKLFLAQAVHRSAPDVRLFVFESDNLLTHPEYADVMRGAMVVTSYPLVDANKSWSNPLVVGESETHRQFGRNAGEGTYNAVLVQLAQFDAEGKTQDGGAPEPLVEYGFPALAGVPGELIEHEGRPPVWITAVGGNAFWPVAALPHDAGRPRGERPPDDGIVTTLSGAWPFAATIPVPLRAPVAASAAVAAPPDPYMHAEVPRDRGKLQAPRIDVLKGVSVLYLLFCAFICVSASLCIFECAGRPLARRGGRLFAHLAVLGPAPGPAPAEAGLARLRDGRERGALLVALALFATFFAMIVWLGIYSAAPRVFREQLAQAFPGWASGETDPFQLARELAGAMAGAACAMAVVLIGLRLHHLRSRLGRRGMLLAALASVALAITLRSATAAVVPWAFHTSPRDLTDVARGATAGISGVFAHWRAIHPASLLSPITPLIALAVILLLALAATLRLLALDDALDREPLLGWRPGLREHALLNPTALCCGVIVGRPPSAAARGGSRRVAAYAIALALALIPATWALLTVRSSLDPGAVELAIRVACAGAVILCLLLMVHMFVLWAELRRWLSEVADSPLRAALAAVRDRITAHLGEGSRMRAPDAAALRLLREQFAAVTRLRSPVATGGGGAGVENELGLDWALASFDRDPAQSRPLREFVGLRAACQIAFAVFRLRSIWLRVAIASMSFVGAIACYPLYPHKELLVLCWALVAAMAGVSIWIFVEMNRNEVLSTISGTEPNKVSWNVDFVEKLAVFGGLPVLSLLAAQFPEVARALLAVVEPVFRGIH